QLREGRQLVRDRTLLRVDRIPAMEHVPAGGEELEEPAELRNDGGTLDRGRDSPGRAMHGLLSSDRPRERINAVEEAGADPDGDTPVVLKLGQRAGTGLVKLADR